MDERDEAETRTGDGGAMRHARGVFRSRTAVAAAAVAMIAAGALGARSIVLQVFGGGEEGPGPSAGASVGSEAGGAEARPERSWLQAIGDARARRYLEANPESLMPASESAEPVDFEVFGGESVESIAERLAAGGIVRDAEAVQALARLRGLDTKIQAGIHTVRADRPVEEVLDALLVAAGDEVVITLREGWRAEEIAEAVARAGLAQAEDFMDLVVAGSADVAALRSLPAGATLEGYLFPDTYRFEPEAGAEAVIARLVETFAARLPADFEAAAQAVGLTPHEVVILASIVEREAVVPSERPRIARVFLNRLDTQPALLNADPTIQYALGFQPELEVWWKRPLLTADLEIDSPYNSYRVPGLPPGPIANPGIASIEAVLEPEAGNWQYFVSDGIACDGTHVFAVTYEEHLANVERYRTDTCGG